MAHRLADGEAALVGIQNLVRDVVALLHVLARGAEPGDDGLSGKLSHLTVDAARQGGRHGGRGEGELRDGGIIN